MSVNRKRHRRKRKRDKRRTALRALFEKLEKDAAAILRAGDALGLRARVRGDGSAEGFRRFSEALKALKLGQIMMPSAPNPADLGRAVEGMFSRGNDIVDAIALAVHHDTEQQKALIVVNAKSREPLEFVSIPFTVKEPADG